MKAAPLRGALSDRARGDRVHVVEGFGLGAVPSTKSALAVLNRVADSRNLLVVLARGDEVSWRSLRNVAEVHLLAADQLNTYDVLCAEHVVFTRSALEAFLAGPANGKPVMGSSTRAATSEESAP